MVRDCSILSYEAILIFFSRLLNAVPVANVVDCKHSSLMTVPQTVIRVFAETE